MSYMITAQQLVDYCFAMLDACYWYACFGQVASEQLYKEKYAQYPDQIGKWPKSTYVEQYGKRVFDCSGLPKAAAGSGGDPNVIPKYRDIESIDWSANTMIEKCTETWSFDNIPEIPGLLVWKPGHVGIFIKTQSDGSKLVIEAAGHMKGVIKSTSTAWKKAGKLPFVDYNAAPAPGPAPTPGTNTVNVKTLKRTTPTMEDPNVLVFQSVMNTLKIRDDNGNELVADSRFGPKCEQVAKRFQRKKGLKDSGIVDPATWDRIING